MAASPLVECVKHMVDVDISDVINDSFLYGRMVKSLREKGYEVCVVPPNYFMPHLVYYNGEASGQAVVQQGGVVLFKPENFSATEGAKVHLAIYQPDAPTMEDGMPGWMPKVVIDVLDNNAEV